MHTLNTTTSADPNFAHGLDHNKWPRRDHAVDTANTHLNHQYDAVTKVGT